MGFMDKEERLLHFVKMSFACDLVIRIHSSLFYNEHSTSFLDVFTSPLQVVHLTAEVEFT